MSRKSSSTGGRCKRGIVRAGGARAGLGAGCTSGFLIGGSGSWAEGGGYWGDGLVAGGFGCWGGEGFCDVDCGELEVCKLLSESRNSPGCNHDVDAGSSAADRASAATSANVTRKWSVRCRTRDKRNTPRSLPAPKRGIAQDTPSARGQNSKMMFVRFAEQNTTWNFHDGGFLGITVLKPGRELSLDLGWVPPSRRRIRPTRIVSLSAHFARRTSVLPG